MSAQVWKMAGQLKETGQDWSGINLPEKDLPPVTVIVPARNEERNIERCLLSLLGQDYPKYEVIAVDDGSTDGTPLILARLQAEYPQLKVVTLSEALPPGWAGKPHAMHAGYMAARPNSQWVLFTDADTVHNHFALSAAVGTAIQEKADLLSIAPRLELKTFWEELLMPSVVLGIMLQYPLEKVNRPDSKVALANGQFLLVRRTIYDKVGGYGGKLKNSLLDDRDMALTIKNAGGRLLLKNGEHLTSVRMYTSFSEIWQGFSKNAFIGSRSAYLSVPFFVLAALLLGVLPFLQLPYALVRWTASGGKKSRKMLSFSLYQVLLMVAARRRWDREMDIPAPYALLSPVTMLVITGILSNSMIRSLTGRGVEWKGRNYSGTARTQQLIK